MFKILKHKIYLVFSVIVLSMISNISFTEEVKNTEDIKNVAEIKNVEEVKNKNYIIEDDSIITEDTYLKNKEKENINETEQQSTNNSYPYIYMYQHIPAINSKQNIFQTNNSHPYIYILPAINSKQNIFQKIIQNKAKRHALFINVGLIGFGYSMQTEIEKGNYNKNEWFNGKDYNSKTYDFYISYGVDYTFLRSKFLNPLIGLFLNVSFTDLILYKTYTKTLSTTNDNGLKKMSVKSTPRVDIGVKLGNVILFENSSMIIPYISAGYSYRGEALQGDYKVDPYEQRSCNGNSCHSRTVDNKTDVIDHFSNHFVFVGTGIDYNISIFRIGIYAKLLHPINDTTLIDNNKNTINFGKRLIFSTGLNIGISIPAII